MAQEIEKQTGVDQVLLRKSLLLKLLSIVIITTAIGSTLLIVKVIKNENKNLFAEQVRASDYMAQPIMHSLYKDMMDEKADLVRYLIAGIKTIEGVERVSVIRENGMEEAFQDLRTLKEVEGAYGELKPEWIHDHPDNKRNAAEGVDNEQFQEALKLFKEGRKEAVYYIEKKDGERLLTFLLPVLKDAKCNSCHARDESIRGVLMISSSLENMYAVLAVGRKKWIVLGSLTMLGTCFALAILARSIITNPILQTTNILKEFAEGKGDLTRRLRVTSDDEVGIMRRTFNRFIEGLQGMIKDILTSSNEVALLSDRINNASEGFHRAAKSQMSAIEDASLSINEMDMSSGNVRSNAEELVVSVRGAFDSSQEMSTAVTEIAGNTEVLDTAVNQTANAIDQIVSFQKQIASHIQALYTEIEQVVSVANVINGAINEVGSLSKEQASLAGQVVQIVATHMDAVNRSTETIDKMIEDVTRTSSILNELGERSKTIGGIIDVISEVADTSRLLSLNATILAAQAGDHGKGFAIVANEVKVLSEQTAVSTKEIAKLIERVQKDITSTAASVEQSISTVVGETVKLSKGTSEAVSNIENSSAATLDMARKVEKASEEQTQAVCLVTEAVNRINEMVAEIKQAVESQSWESDNILRATDHMKKITLDVKRSIMGQSTQGHHIYTVIKDVSEKMQAIINSIREHKNTSERAVRAVEVIRSNSVENASRTRDLDQMVESLSRQAVLLKDKVENFKVS